MLSFLSQKFDGKMIPTGYWNVALKFLEMENMVFFRAKKLMERWYMLITEKFLLWSFLRWEIRSFLSQKFNGKMIFTCCFWVSHVILGLRKYGFSCRAETSFLQLLLKILQWGIPYVSIHSSTYVITCARFVTKQV